MRRQVSRVLTRRQRREQQKRRRNRAVRIGVGMLLGLMALGVWRITGAGNADSVKKMPGELGVGGSTQWNPDLQDIPEYFGEDFLVLNGGVPSFTDEELTDITGEQYSELDELGRCGAAVARLDRSMAPVEERGDIGQIRPTGWKQAKYPGIVESDPPYLYNRCHLIAYALTGQNANEKNLITGTRYMNVHLMLPWEEQVMRCLENTNFHVLYRVTPYFKGKELLARGVELEAYSVEDGGASLCFHVFVYNVQPGVELDYATGESRLKGE